MKSILTDRWSNLKGAEIRALQAKKLRHYLQHRVLPFSQYYKNIFHKKSLTPQKIRTLEDLEKIPFTSKENLLNTPENPQKIKQFILIPEEKKIARQPKIILKALLQGKNAVKKSLEREFRPIFLTSTTGRSSDPIPFLYTQHDLDNLTLSGKRLMEVGHSEKHFRHLNLFPFAPHLAFWQTHYAAIGHNVFSLSTGGGKTIGTKGNVELLKKINPEVLIGMPTFIYHVLQRAVDEKVSVKNLQRIVLGGEKSPQGIRKKLRALAEKLGSPNINVFSTYGFTEARMAFPECPVPHEKEPTGFHLYPDLGIIEVIDPKTGRQVPEETPGEIVFTPLDARGTVILRYRTGDYTDGGLTYVPCPACGRSMPRLLGKISRVSQFKKMQFEKIKGTLVDFNALEHVLDEMENIGTWQIELRKLHDDPMEVDQLILHIEKIHGQSSEITQQIEENFLQKIEIKPNEINFHNAKTMRKKQGVGTLIKEEKILDNRPKIETEGEKK